MAGARFMSVGKVSEDGYSSSHHGLSSLALPTTSKRLVTECAFNHARKHKSPGEPRLRKLGKNGAGEAIRTLDPNLGKVVLYP